MASDDALEPHIQGKHYFQVGQGFPRGALGSAVARRPPKSLRQCRDPPLDLLSAGSSLQTRGAPLSPNHRSPACPVPRAVQFKAVPSLRLVPQTAVNVGGARCGRLGRPRVRMLRARAFTAPPRLGLGPLVVFWAQWGGSLRVLVCGSVGARRIHLAGVSAAAPAGQCRLDRGRAGG